MHVVGMVAITAYYIIHDTSDTYINCLYFPWMVDSIILIVQRCGCVQSTARAISTTAGEPVTTGSCPVFSQCKSCRQSMPIKFEKNVYTRSITLPQKKRENKKKGSSVGAIHV